MSRMLVKDIDVRWGDLDAQNHVNNAAYMTYLEEARLAWFQALDGAWESNAFGPVVVNINCDFRREIDYPAGLRVTLISREVHTPYSGYTIRDRNDPDKLYAEAESTIVWVDRQSGRSIPVPDAARTWLLEPKTESA